MDLQGDDPDGVTLSFTDLSFTPAPQRGACCRRPSAAAGPILVGVSATVPPGSLFAVMGPSGSGKTSLLDLLAGRKSAADGARVGGSVRFNGAAVSQRSWRRLVAYCMQDDALLPLLTVRETLAYALALQGGPPPRARLGRGSKGGRATLTEPILLQREGSAGEGDDAARRVDAVLDVLHLSGVQHQRVGDPLKRGISGGERRRLAIGVELVSQPRVLLVDEGTSGLDATHALRVMRALKRLCVLGHTVVCTVHQPRANIFRLFDGLLLLHRGAPAYCGPAQEAIQWLQAAGHACPQFENPADFMLDLLDEASDEEPEANGGVAQRPPPGTAERLVARCREQQAPDAGELDGPGQAAPAGASLSRGSSWCGQTCTLIRRTALVTARDPAILYIRTAAALGVGGLVGGIFHGQSRDDSSAGNRINVILFVMCCFSLFCLPAISNYCEERLIFVRERAAGRYSTGCYFVATMAVEIPLLALVVV